jgi:hypothetical protein
MFLLLLEGHARETLVPSKKQCFFFQNGGTLHKQGIKFLVLSLSFRRVANVVRPLKMEPIVSSETSASNTRTPGSYPKESLLQGIKSFTFKS